MHNIRTNYIGELEKTTGLQISYDSIRPAFFGTFEIRNLNFKNDNLSLFSVDRARFYFSVIDILFFRKVTIHTVQIEHPVLNVDMNNNGEIWENFLNREGSSPPINERELLQKIAEFLPSNTDYKIRNCFLSFYRDNIELHFENMNIDLKEQDDIFTFYYNFHTEVRNKGLFNISNIIKANVVINGESSNNFNENNAQAHISSLICYQQDSKLRPSSYFSHNVNYINNARELFSMNTVTVNLSYNDGILNVFSPYDLSYDLPYDGIISSFFFSMNTQTSDIFTEVKCANFIPDSIIKLEGSLKNAGYLLSIPLNGFFRLNYNNKELDYIADFYNGRESGSLINDVFEVSFNGSDKNIFINNFEINIPENAEKTNLFRGIVNLSGSLEFYPLKADGTLSINNFSLSGKESIDAVLNISNYGNEIQMISDKLRIGSSSFKFLDIFMHPSQNDFGINVSAVCENEGSIFFDAVLNKNFNEIEASFMLSSLSLFNIEEAFKPFSGFFAIPDYAGVFLKNTYVDTEIFFSSDFVNMAYNVPNIVIWNEKPLARISLSGTNNLFIINESVFYINEEELLISANADFNSINDLIFKINANYLYLTWDVEGQILDRTTLIVRDINGLHVYGNISDTGALSGYIEGKNFPFPTNIYPVYLDFYTTIRYNSKDFWSINIANFQARDINSTTGESFLSVSGAADQDGASFRNIIFNDDIGTLIGSADFSWDSNFSYMQFIVNMTDGHFIGEDYYIEGMLKDNHIGVNASVSDMRINRFLNNNEPMLATADIYFSWDSIEEFEAQIKLSSFQAKIQQETLQASMDLKISNDELLGNNLRLDYAGIRTAFPILHINRKEGIAKASAEIQGFGLKRSLEGKIDLNVNFDKINSWIEYEQIANDFNGYLAFNDIIYGELNQDSMVFEFSGNEGAVSVSGGIKNMLRLEMDNDGNFYLGLSDPMPIRGSVAGIYKNGHIDAHTGNFFIDLESLWSLIPAEEGFAVAGGYITGKMDIRGPVFNPEFFGGGTGSSLCLQAPEFISADIRPVPFNIIAEGYEMTFGPVPVVCGNGGGTINGWFRYEYWTPKNIGLNIIIPRETPIPYDFDITGFLANGDASGRLDLVFDFNTNLMEMRGDLFTNKTEMTLGMDSIMTRSESEPFSDLVMDIFAEVTVTAGPMTEFFWPSVNSPILRVNPEMGTVFNVSVDSQSGQYSLVGDVNVRSGELYYFERNFYIRQGSLTFREDESQFNPFISARAEVRDRSDTGTVTISMIIENQPLLSFEPRFEATPSMTQLEIYSLLGQNLYIAGSDNAETAQRFLLTSTTDLVTQFVGSSDLLTSFAILRPFERQLRNFLNLDMLSVRTRIIQNAVVTGVSGMGVATVDRNTRVGNYFDNTTVFIGKYIGQDMFIQGTFTMRYDENSLLFGGLTFEPDFGIELQSPFLNIRWDFFPYHPENLWVNDNSITLIWSKSF